MYIICKRCGPPLETYPRSSSSASKAQTAKSRLTRQEMANASHIYSIIYSIILKTLRQRQRALSRSQSGPSHRRPPLNPTGHTETRLVARIYSIQCVQVTVILIKKRFCFVILVLCEKICRTKGK